tara:strand:- start:1816 stop:2607 length:792 start_codon:yes stop_codon:yes gene_type:complete
MKNDYQYKLANILWSHWKNGTSIDDIIAIKDILPKDRNDGYKVQKHFSKFSKKGIFGWKIAASNKAGQEHIGSRSPLAGVLLEEKKSNYIENISLLPNQMLVAEVEFIFKMKHDLDFRKSNYSEQDTFLIIESLFAGIELPDSRFLNFTKVGEANLIADNACANQFILGPKLSDNWKNKNLKDQKVSISVNDKIREFGLGENVLGSPILALKWLLNELLEYEIPLKQGHFVSTGTVTKPIPIKKGDILKADYSDLGNFEISLN